MRISPLEQSARFLSPPRLLVLGALPPGDGQPLAWRFVLDPEADFDAVVLGDGARDDEARAAVEGARKPLAPIADLSATPADCAEIRRSATGLASAAEVMAETADIVRRVAALPDPVRQARDPALLLLARCATRRTGLAAAYSVASAGFIHYPGAGFIVAPERHAERLADAGLLARTFFDRLHVCPACRSSRLSVREECPACRGADIDEDSTVHHFACAHLALERAFRAGGELVCPKCRRQLRHFGVDYDKPGMATVCNGCGHVDGEPAIGFRCIDCGAGHDAQAVRTRDWYSYALTPAGEEALARGVLDPAAAPGPPGRETLAFLLRQGLALDGHCGRPMVLVEIAFAALPAIEASHGARFAQRARLLASEAIRGELRAIDFALDRDDTVLVYMPETQADAAATVSQRMLDRVRTVVAVDLSASARMVDPNAVLHDLERGCR